MNEKHDPKTLRNADFATLTMKAHSEVACVLVDRWANDLIAYQFQIGERKNKPNAKGLDGIKQTIGAVVADLLIATLNEDADGWCFRPSKVSAFKGTMAASRPYEAIKKHWPTFGLLEVKNGFRGSDDFDGQTYHPDTSSYLWATRLRATDLLLGKLAEAGITPITIGQHFIDSDNSHQPVILRAEKVKGQRDGRPMKIDDTPKSRKLVSGVNGINDYLSRWEFSFGPAPLLYRIYNDGDLYRFDWNYGGRLYGPKHSYLNWSPSLRNEIKINQDPVTHIDISACQLTLLHGLMSQNIDTEDDPYHIDGFDRNQIKKVVNMMIGAGSASFRGLQWEQSKEAIEVKTAVLQKHPILEQIEETEWSSKTLQAVEADILVETLINLRERHDIPALPVHDCIIVRRQDVEKGKMEFSKAFFDRVGLAPRLTVDHNK